MTDGQVVVAVDFDGTITEEDAYPNGMTRVRPDAKALVDALRGMGCFVVLWTCRSGKELTEALDACREAGIFFDAVNDGNGRRGDSKKVNADIYVDDRSVRTLSEAVSLVAGRCQGW